MSWTSDVAASLDGLDLSSGRLRSFGLAVGAVLVAVGAWIAHRHGTPPMRDAAAIVGLALLVAGALFPSRLRVPYRIWMALAFALGWVMSRVALTVLFALVVTPVAIVARIAGKRFLGLPAEPDAATYWIRREGGRPSRYDKMY